MVNDAKLALYAVGSRQIIIYKEICLWKGKFYYKYNIKLTNANAKNIFLRKYLKHFVYIYNFKMFRTCKKL